MARNDTLTVTMHIDGVRETLRVLNLLPKEANKKLRQSSRKLARALAITARQRGRQEGSQAAAVSRTVRARQDRLPVVSAGGTRKVGRKRTAAYHLLFGSEFGMNRRTGWFAADRYRGARGRQYKRHLGRHSYWFFSSVEERQPTINREWNRAADAIVDRWTRAGGA